MVSNLVKIISALFRNKKFGKGDFETSQFKNKFFYYNKMSDYYYEDFEDEDFEEYYEEEVLTGAYDFIIT